MRATKLLPGPEVIFLKGRGGQSAEGAGDDWAGSGEGARGGGGGGRGVSEAGGEEFG